MYKGHSEIFRIASLKMCHSLSDILLDFNLLELIFDCSARNRYIICVFDISKLKIKETKFVEDVDGDRIYPDNL